MSLLPASSDIFNAEDISQYFSQLRANRASRRATDMPPLMEKFATLFISDRFSDVTIVSGTTKLPAHLNILSLHTNFFSQNLQQQAIMTPGTSTVDDHDSEDETKTEYVDAGSVVKPVVQLHDFLPEAVECMLEYCYRADYTLYSPPPSRPQQPQQPQQPPPPSDGNTGEKKNESDETKANETAAKEQNTVKSVQYPHTLNMWLHIHVYNVAKHVCIPELQQLAVSKFQATGTYPQGLCEVAMIFHKLKTYDKHDENDLMRLAIVQKIAHSIGLTWQSGWRKFFEKCGELGAQVVDNLVAIKNTQTSPARKDIRRVLAQKERETLERIEKAVKETREKVEKEIMERIKRETNLSLYGNCEPPRPSLYS